MRAFAPTTSAARACCCCFGAAPRWKRCTCPAAPFRRMTVTDRCIWRLQSRPMHCQNGSNGCASEESPSKAAPTGRAAGTASISAIPTDICWSWRRRDFGRSTRTMTGTLEVSLWRGSAEGSYRRYQVPWRENQTVLDVVTWVQRNLDATLSYRFACRVGMCGSCAMTVNGRPRWTCRTHVSKVATSGRLTIGPLENLPVIKDLTTDMQP